MLTFFRWTFRLLFLLIVIAGAFFIHVWYFKPAKIDWFYGRLFGQIALESPQMLSSMRILPPWADFYSDKLDDSSPSREAELSQRLKDGAATLASYDRSKLDDKGRLSYDVLEDFMKMELEGDQFRHYNYPVNQMFGVQSSLPDFMVQQHPVKSAKDARNYIRRLDAFREKFAQVIEGLKLREAENIVPPQFTVEAVLAQMRAFVVPPANENILYTSFREKLDKLPDGKVSPADREDLLKRTEASINGYVYPAYRDLTAYFDALQPKAQGNFGAWHLPDGDAYYAYAVRQHTTTDMTPEQVHQLGLSEVARISTEMDAILIAQGLTEGSIGARVQQLARQPEQMYPNTPEGKTAMLAEYQRILDDINGKLDPAFDIRPKLGVEVRAIPAMSEKTAPGAYYQRGAFDGSRPGVFYANMRDPGENPKFAMRTLAYHEGIPGHHFQISIAQELTGVPFFRKVLPFTAFAEGWALYSERLAWEMGFEENPLDNLGRLRDEMMRGVRLVVDSGIHYKHWTREQAIAYMMENTGMSETDVTAEIQRYFVNPGQALAYKAGMLKILELRERAKTKLGTKFDLRRFHDVVLSNGSLPMALLERVVDDWIAKQS